MVGLYFRVSSRLRHFRRPEDHEVRNRRQLLARHLLTTLLYQTASIRVIPAGVKKDRGQRTLDSSPDPSRPT